MAKTTPFLAAFAASLLATAPAFAQSRICVDSQARYVTRVGIETRPAQNPSAPWTGVERRNLALGEVRCLQLATNQEMRVTIEGLDTRNSTWRVACQHVLRPSGTQFIRTRGTSPTEGCVL